MPVDSRGMEDPATPELLERWMRGDSDAAAEIYRRYIDRVERFTMKFVKDTLTAEEVAAETFAQALAGTREGKRPERFTYWLLAIARNLAVLRRRADIREGAGSPEDMPSSRPGPGTVQVRGEVAGALNLAIDHLSPSSREVIDLFREESLDREEIAERLGLEREAVDRRFARAHAALRDEIRKHVTSLVLGPKPVSWEDVRALRPSFRKAFTMRHLEGRSEEDTARRLGIPPATLKARLEKACEQLGCRPGDDFSDAREGYRCSL